MLAQDVDDPMLLKPAPRSAALAMLWQIPGAKLVTAVGEPLERFDERFSPAETICPLTVAGLRLPRPIAALKLTPALRDTDSPSERLDALTHTKERAISVILGSYR
jgi:hypothetical protein